MMKQILTKLLIVIETNGKRSVGALVGLLIAIMILLIGFLKTLFIFICAVMGFYLGDMPWDKAKIKDWLEKILPPGRIG